MIAIPGFLLVCAVLALVYYLRKWFPLFKQWRLWHAALDDTVPHLPLHWLFGSLPNIKSHRDLIHMHKPIINSGSKFFLWWLGPVRACVGVVHPDTVRHILKTSLPKCKSGAGYDLLKPWIGDGLLLSDGEKWERNRRLLTPAFHFDILRPYVKIYNQVAKTLTNKLARECEGGGYVEVCRPSGLATLDTMLQCSLSYKDNIQERGQSHPYVNAVERLSHLLLIRSLNIVYHYSYFIYGLTKNGKEFQALCDYAHSFSSKIINSRRTALQNDPDLLKRKHIDFLDILISARDENGKGLTDSEIQDEVDTFMFEGHDTTSSAISWILYCLGKYPEEQERVREEVLDVLGDREEIEWGDFAKMTYMPMFIRECMRMYPPVPAISRELTEDIEIEGVFLPKGVIIDIPIYNIHRNPHVWKDPEEFRPERFEPETFGARDPYCFVPFSAGPRNCIGQNFAMNEIKVFISHIVMKFHVKDDPKRTPVAVSEVVLRSEDGIYLNFTPRK
ncbi:cytochrome P450 4A24-like [Gigantopelta aegis]|uniref:cytochrome P450 4A24-like n=1 Tax=Gigantopelta aegis TaxID=1735272 RepID=UPI001B889EAD|nr:cytochrome P450 4A24-like [Gigantopelta aegis]